MSSAWFARSFGAAIADVRQRVLEEPYYGKIVTPRATSITIGAPGEKSPGEALGWTVPGGQDDRGVGSGWLERNFAPDPAQQDRAGERDIHGNERAQEHGRER